MGKARRDYWTWWGGFYAWCRRTFGPFTEGFTGIINRTGPLHNGFSANEADAIWGLGHDAWMTGGRGRAWTTEQGTMLIGNPPFTAEAIRRFCVYARTGQQPVIGILPASAGPIVTRRLVKAAGGKILAMFRAGTCAFVPYSFFRGETSRGTAANRRMDKQVLIAGWRVPAITSDAQDELTALTQAASHSHLPVIEEGEWAREALYRPTPWNVWKRN